MLDPADAPPPRVRAIGVDGLLVSFGDALSEDANRAALAFRAALEADPPEGVVETATSLVSAYVRIDLERTEHAAVAQALRARLAERDWLAAPLPPKRRLWRIPTAYGPPLAPQLAEAAAQAGLSPQAAAADLSAARVRVTAIGFAPGMPYLGALPPHWDVPRQTALTPRVPAGALTVAIRQFVLFAVSAPTGWRHVGQTAFRPFRPDSPEAFALRPGDEAMFVAAPAEAVQAMTGGDPDGGASWEVIG